MKPLIAALILGLFSLSPCFGQTQTGNASYNASKNGLTLAHSSMSFGTRVRITNLRNNREVIATVDGRIPVTDPRIADISAEAGNAIGMSSSGYTEVRLEQLLHETTAAAIPAPVPTPSPAEAPTGQAAENNNRVAAAAVPPQPSAPPPSGQAPNQESRVVESIQVITPQPQYLAAPPAAVVQGCFASPLDFVILILLIIAVLLLTAILVLLLAMRRFPWWPWFYPLWARRHARYLKNRRL
jgi:rare lipoprotein A